MNTTKLERINYRLLKLCNRYEAAAKKDPALKPMTDELRATWYKLAKLEEERALVVAERKDKGEVLWTVFQPAKYGGRRITTRTPHRICTEEIGGMFAHGAKPTLATNYGNYFRWAMEERR